MTFLSHSNIPTAHQNQAFIKYNSDSSLSLYISSKKSLFNTYVSTDIISSLVGILSHLKSVFNESRINHIDNHFKRHSSSGVSS